MIDRPERSPRALRDLFESGAGHALPPEEFAGGGDYSVASVCRHRTSLRMFEQSCIRVPPIVRSL
ncbi:Uncharacterised protein [Mycobacteroides abscessus subsp. massiliense]|nr:Uncharacterised protein [Mycobacteroides abscessus subsp. massiliense]